MVPSACGLAVLPAVDQTSDKRPQTLAPAAVRPDKYYAELPEQLFMVALALAHATRGGGGARRLSTVGEKGRWTWKKDCCLVSQT